MSVLQFISALTASLAWPLAVAAGAYFLRDPLKRVLAERQIKRLKAGPSGLEVDFEEQLEQTENKLEASQPRTVEDAGRLEEKALTDRTQSEPQTFEDESFVSDMDRLARVSPPAAVLSGFTRLESELRKALDPAGDTAFIPIGRMSRLAVDQELLSPVEANALKDVSQLRNTVVHSHEASLSLDYETAMRYVDLIKQLLISIHKRH